MAFRLPAPPPDSCFWTEEDGLGRPLLRWRVFTDGGRWLAALLLGLGLCAWAGFGLGLLFAVLGGFQGLDPYHRLFLGGVLVGWVIVLVRVAGWLRGLLRTPEREHLLFKPAAGPNSRKSASTGWGCGGG